MKRLRIVLAIAAAAVLVGSILVMISLLWESNALKHETDRWAVIQDVNSDRVAVETASDEVWSDLVQMRQNGSKLFVGSLVERYDNKWGFHFRPQNLTIAQFTAEGLQATIRYISENLDYWSGGWAYVSANVVETHSP